MQLCGIYQRFVVVYLTFNMRGGLGIVFVEYNYEKKNPKPIPKMIICSEAIKPGQGPLITQAHF